MKTTITTNSLKIIRGDLFYKIEDNIRAGNNGTSILVPHVCNNINLFGGGFADAVSQHYPEVKENYHLLGSKFLKNSLGYVQFVEVLKIPNFNHRLIFANMIAQNGIINKKNPRPLNYFALAQCMNNVKKYIQQHFNDEPIQIRCPKFGCGLAGGNWTFIKDLINDIWYSNNVYIYQKDNI